MIDITITLEGLAEFKEPKPYEHFPAIRVEVFKGVKTAIVARFYHRCECIMGLDSEATEAEAISVAKAWLNDTSNSDSIIQEIIAAIGE